jgi:hypothetical protein
MLAHIPSVVLTSKLTTKGSESTSYSLMAGVSNLGSLLSIVLGYALAQVLHLELGKSICSIDSIGTFVVLSQIGLPAATLLFVYLVPDGNMQSKLLE